ncbi:hypothetical protein Q8A67_018028 [Cirrhinus molitorella]|uniref:Uncharacterized protein n=1 Tax=Cirrhinus molitorella TaxID=172907 RepID=A0AA88PB97_9TELE|nr:hypothetical protein Q8A67_018028 [Cirrhinus molitorella]
MDSTSAASTPPQREPIQAHSEPWTAPRLALLSVVLKAVGSCSRCGGVDTADGGLLKSVARVDLADRRRGERMTGIQAPGCSRPALHQSVSPGPVSSTAPGPLSESH